MLIEGVAGSDFGVEIFKSYDITWGSQLWRTGRLHCGRASGRCKNFLKVLRKSEAMSGREAKKSCVSGHFEFLASAAILLAAILKK